MLDDTASRTALGVAYIRAAHQTLDPEPLLFEDPLALALLGPDAAETIEAFGERYQTPFGRGLRSHVCLRSRFTEDKLREAAARGVGYYVLVGAGFDTFAWRQPDWAKRLRIVEIDHPATQDAKREKIAAAGLSTPQNMLFDPVDFTRESLADGLGRAGIGPDDGVFFSWLGVTMYLPKPAIDASLAAMANAARHSEVCLTFKRPPQLDIPGDRDLAAYVASLGEAFVSHFTEEEIAATLNAHGFGTLDFLTAEKAKALYFTPPRGGIPAPRHTTIVYAAK